MKNKMLTDLRERLKGSTLDELQNEINVTDCDMLDYVPEAFDGWHAVSTDEDIVAYFVEEAEAFRYRLDLMNQILNT